MGMVLCFVVWCGRVWLYWYCRVEVSTLMADTVDVVVGMVGGVVGLCTIGMLIAAPSHPEWRGPTAAQCDEVRQYFDSNAKLPYELKRTAKQCYPSYFSEDDSYNGYVPE